MVNGDIWIRLLYMPGALLLYTLHVAQKRSQRLDLALLVWFQVVELTEVRVFYKCKQSGRSLASVQEFSPLYRNKVSIY